MFLRSLVTRKTAKSQSPLLIDRSITLIGPQGAGKTTYLSTLANFPKERYQESSNAPFIVRPKDTPHERKLKNNIQNKIKPGLGIEPTTIQDNWDEVEYRFHVQVNCVSPSVTISLNTTDFPGEGLNPDQGLESIINPGSKCRKFLERKLTEQGQDQNFLILLDKWEPEEGDAAMTDVFETFTEIVKDNGDPGGMTNWRFAIAMNKCERGELWPLRHDPRRDIFQRFLPETKSALEDFIAIFKIPPKNLEFFAMSTFGVLKDSPRPNRKKESPDSDRDVLMKPLEWKPYGLLDPLYWLATGRRLKHRV